MPNPLEILHQEQILHIESTDEALRQRHVLREGGVDNFPPVVPISNHGAIHVPVPAIPRSSSMEPSQPSILRVQLIKVTFDGDGPLGDSSFGVTFTRRE